MDATKLEEQLREIPHNSADLFFPDEFSFLKPKAPYYFSKDIMDKHMNENPDDAWLVIKNSPVMLLELNQIIFDTAVKLDISLYRGADVEQLVREKSAILNPIFKAFKIETITSDGSDPLIELCKMKICCLEALKRTLGNTRFPNKHRTVEEDLNRILDNLGMFFRAGNDLFQLFGDVPFGIYGSSLTKQYPEDNDTFVELEELTIDIYRRIANKIDRSRKPRLSFVLIPKNYTEAFFLSDTSQKYHPDNSIMLNKKIYYPDVSKAYLDELRLTEVVTSYIKLRESVTPTGLEQCKNILPRINNKIKAPRFIHEKLCIISGRNMQKPEIRQLYELPPNREELIDHLITANLQAYLVLNEYITGSHDY